MFEITVDCKNFMCQYFQDSGYSATIFSGAAILLQDAVSELEKHTSFERLLLPKYQSTVFFNT